jgi:glycolate oxidase
MPIVLLQRKDMPASKRLSLEVSQDDLANKFRRFIKPENIIVDEETKKPYECDGLSVYCKMPMIVVLPETVDEVCEIMRICHENNVPVVARGAGTGLSAGAMPHDEGVVLSLAKFDKILEIDTEARLARVEPGVTNLSISEAVAEAGFYYGPDPSSQIACSIGGNVAENAGGVHCLKYGLTIHNIYSAKIVTVEGDLLILGSDALDSPGLDMMALITGSEGLLGITVEVTVKLLPTPEVARLVMACFSTVQQAGDAVAEIIGAGIIPAGLEMMDSLAIKAAEDHAKAGYPKEADALLLCEVDGTVEEVEDHIRRVEVLFKNLGATTIRISQNEAERALLWKGRKSAFPAIGRISPDYYCMDGTIPRGQISHVLAEMTRMSEEYGLRVANVFHAGDGNLHPLILFDANVAGELKRAEEFGGKILELCVKVGGCITGEHGVGIEKIRQMPSQFSDQEITQFHDIKKAFDPIGTLNPGKGIPSLRQCQEYRALEGPLR